MVGPVRTAKNPQSDKDWGFLLLHPFRISRIKRKKGSCTKVARNTGLLNSLLRSLTVTEGLSDYFEFDKVEAVSGSTYIYLVESSTSPFLSNGS